MSVTMPDLKNEKFNYWCNNDALLASAIMQGCSFEDIIVLLCERHSDIIRDKILMEIKVDDKVQVIVKTELRDIYYPTFLHDMTGDVWDINETHIWIKSILRDIDTNKSYMSGPHRYRLDDITLTQIKDNSQ